MILAIDSGTVQTALVEWDGQRIAGRWLVPNVEALELVGATSADEVVVEMVATADFAREYIKELGADCAVIYGEQGIPLGVIHDEECDD